MSTTDWDNPRDPKLEWARDHVHRYVESTIFGDEVARPLPEFDGPFRASVHATVLVATR